MGKTLSALIQGRRANILITTTYYYPRWSPDGQTLLFNADYYKEKQASVFTANPDGSNLTRITPPGTGYNFKASWSPDGAYIAYLHADTDGPEQIFNKTDNQLWLVNRDGSQATMLADNIIGTPNVNWSPDGKWIAVPTTDGIGLFSPNGEKQILQSYSERCAQWSPSSTGWPLTYVAMDKETQEYNLNIIPNAQESPFSIKGISSGPYWSPNRDIAMVVRSQVVDAEKKIYSTTVCFWQAIPNLWP